MTQVIENKHAENFIDDFGFNVIPIKENQKSIADNEYARYFNEIYFKPIADGQNIGVILGKTSNNLICFDCDAPELYDYLKHYENQTFIVKSGKKGYHVYFRLMELDKNYSGAKIIKDGKTIELFLKNRFMVLPPSFIKGESIRPYEIISNNKPKYISLDEYHGILQSLKDNGFTFKGTKESNSNDYSKTEVSTKELLNDDWAIGCRYDNGFKLALRRFHLGWEYERVKEEALKKNSTLTNPADYDHVIEWVNGAQLQHKKNIESGNNYFKPTEEFLKDKQESPETKFIDQAITYLREFDIKESFKKIEAWNDQQENKISELVRHDLFKQAKKKLSAELKESRNTNENEDVDLNYVRDLLLSKYDFMTINDKTRELYIYKNGVYILGGMAEIDVFIEQNYEIESTSKFRNEVLEKIKIKTLIDRESIDEDDNIINLKNGLFNIDTGKFSPHTPNHKSIIQWNVNYDKNAKCSNFFKFLNEVILEPKERKTVLEMMASLLWKKDTLTKSFFLLGGGSNGKTSLRDIICQMIGQKNYTELGFSDLSDKYLPAQLYAKIANIPDEIDDTKIVQSATWKTITAKKSIMAQNKYGQPFSFIPYAKNIMPCNRPPPIEDKSDGTYRRIVPIHFNQIFTTNLTPELEQQGQKKADQDFTDSLLEEKEISGIFNILTSIVKQLKKRKRLTYELSVAEVRNEWEILTNTVKEYISEKLEKHDESVALKTDYYRNYLKFCENKKYNPEGQNTFYAKFQQEGAIPGKSRINGKGNPMACFRGFKMKDTPTNTQKDNKKTDFKEVEA